MLPVKQFDRRYYKTLVARKATLRRLRYLHMCVSTIYVTESYSVNGLLSSGANVLEGYFIGLWNNIRLGIGY
jgi:hypothetical protein